MNKLETKRQEKERGISVDEVISDTVAAKESLKEIIIVGITDDDKVATAYSFDDRLRIIGILETLKNGLIDELNYPDI